MVSQPPGGRGGDGEGPGDHRTRAMRDAVADTHNPVTLGGAFVDAKELEPGDVVGGYRIESVLGEGGMGKVYGAIHPLIGKRAAIKVLKREMCSSAEVVERFVQEARAVNEIGHPNIVDVFAFGTLPDGRSWYAMEWLAGESLAERLERRRVPVAEACDILIEVIRALDAAHARQIIHRDLKPDNVFLVEAIDDRPRVKLLDFGIAKLVGGDDRRVERTRTGALIGTPQYIAPEQARGHQVDARTDVYSLGVMAFEVLTGQVPFDADNAADLIAQHLAEPAPRLAAVAPDLPPALDGLIAAMLEKDPGKRPTLGRVREELAAARDAGPAAAVAAKLRGGAAAVAPPPAPVAARPPAPAPARAPGDPFEPPEPGDLGELELVPTATPLAATPPPTPAPAGGPRRPAATLALDPDRDPDVERVDAPARGRTGLVVAVALVAVAAIAAFVLVRGRHDAGAAPRGGASGATGATGATGAASGSAPVADASLELTLSGPAKATLTIDGETHELWKGPPSTIPVPPGRHDVTVEASGFRTFHTSVDAAAGARIAVTARLERAP